jgi:hypothetical protein
MLNYCLRMILLLSIFSFTCCTFHEPENIAVNGNDTISRPYAVCSCASLLNMAFSEEPVYYWAEFCGKYIDSLQPKLPSNIITIKFTRNSDSSSYFLCFETSLAGSNFTNSLDSNCKIESYAGDRNLIITDHGMSKIYYNVLEDRKFDREFNEKYYVRVPVVGPNIKGDTVCLDDIEISIDSTNEKDLDVSVVYNSVVKTLRYKRRSQDKLIRIRYYSKIDGNLYYLSNKEENYYTLENKEELKNIFK